uniref:DUF7918 domain-containing protein n=1 Tax=Psilocybe cubensis TaxID=181762 RepID=A0A8H8CM00_PSICU
MGVEILLDGKIVRKKFLFPHRPTLVGTVSGALTSPTEERQFKFGTPKLTDDDQYLDNKSSMHIGDIRMVIRKKSDFDPKEEKISSTYDVSEAVIIHEKTKKGLAHIVTYGETKMIEKQVAYKSKNCGILATFIFNYRPRGMLQAYGVIRNPGLSGYSHRCPGLAYKPTETYMKRGWNHDLEDNYDMERTRKNIKLEPSPP